MLANARCGAGGLHASAQVRGRHCSGVRARYIAPSDILRLAGRVGTCVLDGSGVRGWTRRSAAQQSLMRLATRKERTGAGRRSHWPTRPAR